MSAPAGTGCVYCGLPRARVRAGSGKVRTLPACLPHVDLLAFDPAYSFDRAIVAELAGLDEKGSTRSTSSVAVHSTQLAAMPP